MDMNTIAKAVYRKGIPPLYKASEIHAVLVALAVGDLVPHQVLINDYKSGIIPAWSVAEREESGILTVLTLIDLNTQKSDVFSQGSAYCAYDVFTAPERVLAGPMYLYFPGCIHARNQLGDIRQDARVMAERMAGVKQGLWEPSPGTGKKAKEREYGYSAAHHE
jgi:hypothetical protein